jgi:hypothetical protein
MRNIFFLALTFIIQFAAIGKDRVPVGVFAYLPLLTIK